MRWINFSDELVPVCNINDVNVEDCIRSSANKIMPILAKGKKHFFQLLY